MFSGSLLAAICYGIALALYYMCARALRRQLVIPEERKSALIALGYITFAMICATVFLCFMHYLTQLNFVLQRGYLGGPGYRAPNVAALIFWDVLDWLTLGVQIWRLSVVWSRSRWRSYVLAIPVVLLLGCIAIQSTAIASQTRTGYVSQTIYVLNLCFFAIPPIITFLITTFITFRIARARRQLIRLLNHESEIPKQYLSVIAMFIESYALDAIWGSALVLTYASCSNLVFMVFFQPSAHIKVRS
ncbi:hypothetical protein NP233_g9930 [Leucocoprinus birnbaumii]|uniref:Uncharacterized protein n=1 Tax=Leucocoprinus birnbaumii TaxID=56174 RepID=A0AAD5VN30_9AGAR|nr:hypothetical protein NP233_g9930 [Leucocoprinus birnbaumii]